MLLSFFYEISLILLGLAALPKMLYMRLLHNKYRQSFSKRFGKDFPRIEKNGRYLIWIHAVSVGETKVAASMVKMLKAELNNPLIVVSSVTETGHAEAQRSIPLADHHVYLPFDFGWIMKPIIKKVSPDLVILCESDFWYNFLNTAKKQGAQVALINGKISEESMKLFKKAAWFSERLFALIDVFCIQNRHYKERFEDLGVPPEKITVTGNMKFDDACPQLTPEQLNAWKKQLGIREGDQVLVIGSTHDPEEKQFLALLQDLWQDHPKLKVILVPRHPERFNEVASIIQRQNISFQRFTSMNGQDPVKVILMDAMGLLRKCYQLADVALVGGSFTNKVGGHNIMEPSWYGVPVLFGPFMHAQPELVELVEEYGSGEQVGMGNLGIVLDNILKNAEKRQSLGKAGLKLVSDMNGATRKTWQVITPIAKAESAKR